MDAACRRHHHTVEQRQKQKGEKSESEKAKGKDNANEGVKVAKCCQEAVAIALILEATLIVGTSAGRRRIERNEWWR